MAIRKVPIPYERKNRRKSDAPVTKPVKPIIADKLSKPVKKKDLTHIELLDTPNPEIDRNVQIRLVSRIPTHGQLTIYDDMTKAGMSPRQAILGIWKRDFEAFETKLNSKTTIKLEQIQFDKTSIETTRKVSSQFYNKAKNKFDPFDILSKRALGQKIGEAILCLSRKEGENDIQDKQD